MHTNTSDLDLLQAWQRHQDSEAFHAIVSRHARLVYNTCRHIVRNDADAADVSQECFLCLATTPPDIHYSLAGWLHRLATHRSLDHLKAANRRREREIRYARETRVGTAREKSHLMEQVDEAIDRLPDDLRLPLIDHFLRQKTHQEVAEDLGIPRRTATFRIGRGVDELRKELSRKGVAVPALGLAAALEAELAGAMEAPAALHVALGKHALAGATPGGTAGAAGTGAGALGTLLLLKKGWAAAAVMVGILLAWWLLSGGNQTGPGSPGPTATPLSQVADPDGDEGNTDAAPDGEALEMATDTDPIITSTNAETVGQVTGRVFDADSGAPVPEATVLIKPRNGTVSRGATAQTGPDGVYGSQELPAGDYLVYLGAVPGYPATSEKNVGHYHKLQPQMDGVGVNLTGDTTIDFPVHQGLYLKGIVVNKRGKGVPGVAVSAAGAGEYNSQTTETGADGAFHLAGFSPTTALALRASKPGFGSVNMEKVALTSPGIDDMRIELPNAASISGTVRRADGLPLANARVIPVHVSHYGSWPFAFSHVETDEDGAFLLSDLGPGRYTLQVFPEGYQSFYDQEPTQIDLREGEQRTGVEVVVELGAGFELSGIVTDPEGTPLAGSFVNLYGQRDRTATTDADGRFIIGGLAEGEYSAEPYKHGYRDEKQHYGNELKISADREDLALVLHKNGLTVVGRVVDGASGAPVSGFEVTSRPGEHVGEIGRSVWYDAERVYDPNGAFRLEQVNGGPGRCTVFARVEGHGEGFTVAEVPEDADEIEVTVAIVEGLTYTGRVVADSGAPVRGAIIAAGDNYDNGAYGRNDIALTREDGTFRATGVSKAFEIFSAVHPRYATATVSAESGGANRVLRFQFEAAGRITAQITTDGQPTPLARVTVSSESVPNFKNRYSATDQRGLADIGPLPPGQYTVETARTAGAWFVFKAETGAVVHANETTLVPFALSGATALGGTLLVNGLPPNGGEVVFDVNTGDTTANHTPQLKSDGTWWIDGAMPGKGLLNLVGVDGSTGDVFRRSIEIELAPGESRTLDLDLAVEEAETAE